MFFWRAKNYKKPSLNTRSRLPALVFQPFLCFLSRNLFSKQKMMVYPFSKLRWQWQNNDLKMYLLLKKWWFSINRHVSWSWRLLCGNLLNSRCFTPTSESQFLHQLPSTSRGFSRHVRVSNNVGCWLPPQKNNFNQKHQATHLLLRVLVGQTVGWGCNGKIINQVRQTNISNWN